MLRFPTRILKAIAMVALLALAGGAAAQVNLLWYKEVAADGRIYVFNDPNVYTAWEGSKEMGKSITRVNFGPNGETVVFDSDAAMDLYNFKHNRDAEVRPYAPPKAPSFPPPTTLKVGDGELKFGLLLQAWYVMDDSAASTGTSQLRNTTGVNSFLLRRAEIKINGKITPAWGFEVMLDPSKSQGTAAGTDQKILQDLAVSYLGLKGHEFMFGQKKIFLTEEGVRSSSALDFAERSLVVRAISDRRETGVFWKADWSELVTTYFSATNGTVANTNDDSNDGLFLAGRVDVKPVKGLNIGGSFGTSQGEGLSHLGRERFGAHVRWEATDDLPFGFRAEYYEAKDESIAGSVRSDLKRNGWYASGLYTFAKQFQFGLRYEEFNRNKDVSGQKQKIFTGGLHYLIKGNNANLKLNVESVKDEGRKVNSVLDESYLQGVLAAQVSF
jgi:hypothetical protein